MLGSSYPGVAQFGSALEWGSRGREFDSRHSDQKTSSTELVFFLLYTAVRPKINALHRPLKIDIKQALRFS